MASQRQLLASLVCVVSLPGAGCGQDVATCATICGYPGAPGECEQECDGEQADCGSSGYEGNFQAYLTCMGNAGSYAAIDGICEGVASEVAGECGPGSGSGSDSGVICAELTECCEILLDSPADCTVPTDGDEATCTGLVAKLEAAGECAPPRSAGDSGT